MIEYYEGVIKIANIFLSVVAGVIAMNIFMVSRKNRFLKPWYILVFVLILFAVQEILGVLRAFNIYSTPHLTHIVPTIILGLLIWALVLRINTK